jgi:hypothetical protein
MEGSQVSRTALTTGFGELDLPAKDKKEAGAINLRGLGGLRNRAPAVSCEEF